MNNVTKFQIGKLGITLGVIDSLELALKNHRIVRISALKSSGRDREIIKTMAEQIISQLKTKCEYRIIGFTIILMKQKAKE